MIEETLEQKCERYRRALQKIKNWKVDSEGALASSFCYLRDLAAEALDPTRLTERAVEHEGRRKDRIRKKKFRKGERYFAPETRTSQTGVWVRVLPEGVDQDDCVKVRVLDVVGPLVWKSTLHVVGAVFDINVWNLREAE